MFGKLARLTVWNALALPDQAVGPLMDGRGVGPPIHSVLIAGRARLASAIEHVRRTGGVLVAAKLDRIPRAVIDFASLLRDAERQGRSMLVLDLQLDTTTPAGAVHGDHDGERHQHPAFVWELETPLARCSRPALQAYTRILAIGIDRPGCRRIGAPRS